MPLSTFFGYDGTIKVLIIISSKFTPQESIDIFSGCYGIQKYVCIQPTPSMHPNLLSNPFSTNSLPNNDDTELLHTIVTHHSPDIIRSPPYLMVLCVCYNL